LPAPRGALETAVAGADAIGSPLVGGRPVHLIGFSSVLHHLPDYVQAVRQAGEMLASPGVLYITHEPLPAQVPGKTFAMRAVGLVDTLLRTPQQLYKNVVRARAKLPPTPPAPLMDYHDKGGLDLAALLALLEDEGLEIVMQRRYKDRKMAVMALLDTYVLRTPNWKFALLARRA